MSGLTILLAFPYVFSQWYFDPFISDYQLTTNVEPDASSTPTSSETSSSGDYEPTVPSYESESVEYDKNDDTITVRPWAIYQFINRCNNTESFDPADAWATFTGKVKDKTVQIPAATGYRYYEFPEGLKFSFTHNMKLKGLKTPEAATQPTNVEYEDFKLKGPSLVLVNSEITLDKSVTVTIQNFYVSFVKNTHFVLKAAGTLSLEQFYIQPPSISSTISTVPVINIATPGATLNLTQFSILGFDMMKSTVSVINTEQGALHMKDSIFQGIKLVNTDSTDNTAPPLFALNPDTNAVTTENVYIYSVDCEKGNGAIYRITLDNENHQVKLESTTITSCGVQNGAGGAMYVLAKVGTITLSQVTFSACYIKQTSHSWLSNAKANEGSAIYFDVKAKTASDVKLAVSAVKVTKKVVEPPPELVEDILPEVIDDSVSSEGHESSSSTQSESSEEGEGTVIFLAVNTDIAEDFYKENNAAITSLSQSVVAEEYNDDSVATVEQKVATGTSDDTEDDILESTQTSASKNSQTFAPDDDDDGFPGWAIALIVVFAVVIIVIILFAIMFLCRSQDEDETKDDKYEEDEDEEGAINHESEMQQMEPQVEHEKEEDEPPTKEEEPAEEEPGADDE